MVLRLTSCSPRRSGLLSPSSALLLADLTPASGRQNDTTSPSASAPFVTCAARVHRIPPRVRDVRNAPLPGQDSDRYRSDLGQARRKIFLQKGLDKPFRKTRSDLPVRQNQLIGFDNFTRIGTGRSRHSGMRPLSTPGGASLDDA